MAPSQSRFGGALGGRRAAWGPFALTTLLGCETPDYGGRGSGPTDPASTVPAPAVASEETTTTGADHPVDTDTATSDPDPFSASTTEGGSTSEGTGMPTTEDAPTFSQDVWPMFKARCSCHVGFPAGGLALQQGTAHVSIVGASAVGADMDYVVPGDLDDSYLWRKLMGEQAEVGGDGVQMPQAGIPLIDEELDLVERWILGGAEP